MNGRDALDKVVLLRSMTALLQRHLGELNERPGPLEDLEKTRLREFVPSVCEFEQLLAAIEQRLVERQG